MTTPTTIVPRPFARACGHAGQHLGRALGRTLLAAYTKTHRPPAARPLSQPWAATPHTIVNGRGAGGKIALPRPLP